MVTTKYDLALEYTGGFPAPLVTDAGKFAVAAVDAFGEPTLVYQTQTASVANDAFASTLAPHLRGLGLTVDSSGNLATRTRPRRRVYEDDFLGGDGVSGRIGQLGWTLSGVGTPAVLYQPRPTFGGTHLRLTVTAALNDRTSLTMGTSESNTVGTVQEVELLQTVFSNDNQNSNVRKFFGFIDTFANDPTTTANSFGIICDLNTSANFRLISRASSLGSAVDTGVAFPTNADMLITIHQSTPGTFRFYNANTLIGTISSGVPTAAMNLGYQNWLTTAGANRRNLLGYFGMIVNRAGAYDDDTFLEA